MLIIADVCKTSEVTYTAKCRRLEKGVKMRSGDVGVDTQKHEQRNRLAAHVVPL